ncbi:hypothetical protein P280DRAFT_386693 [Massarina eburnea CBS 473.64]|uniref:Uncharacterized protein n=1 Tax=Massarina eburnea CBS 473.64 TaxID=1395130 RepID=A0A6A6SFB8_9PLEO|nr:hypothetical protein P280DRAFT_386693 [Massarina eburnea CBS 473.64]
MPYLPFHSTAPSPSPSPTLSPTPSIVLHPASAGSSAKKELFKSTDDMASAYRKRYAQYLASTFNMSLEAAMVEADTQLAPRRSSSVSEAEAFRQS